MNELEVFSIGHRDDRGAQVQQSYHKLGLNASVYFKTRLYMIRKTSLLSAVVAQPGRALDLINGLSNYSRVKLKTELS